MKNSIIIASAVAAGISAVTYLVKRKRARKLLESTVPVAKRSHHRTEVFSKAKGAVNYE